MTDVWLTTAYFGPVEYYAAIIEAERVWIEACENYEKQSYRNRCTILSANGSIVLSVPVLNGRSPGQPVRDIRIDYCQNWQKLHFKSVESAYRHSPFYEFIIDDLMVFWNKQEKFLFDYNLMITERILQIMKIRKEIGFTSAFRVPGSYGNADFRYLIHPKVKERGTSWMPVPYHQVFSDRFGFVPNLSILDQILNLEGWNVGWDSKT